MFRCETSAFLFFKLIEFNALDFFFSHSLSIFVQNLNF